MLAIIWRLTQMSILNTPAMTETGSSTLTASKETVEFAGAQRCSLTYSEFAVPVHGGPRSQLGHGRRRIDYARFLRETLATPIAVPQDDGPPSNTNRN